MSEAALAPKTFSLWIEKLLCFAGKFLTAIPPDMRMRVPFGINRGFLWVRGSANAPEWLGIYEYRKQRVLRRVVRQGATVCDIGANAGFYTLAMSRLVGANGRVLAFEPWPANIQKLRRHLAINNIQNVAVSDYAVCHRSGKVAFARGDSDFTGKLSDGSSSHLEVNAITLDEFFEQRDGSDPSLLKIDVEGGEADVLEGARNLIERVHPALLLALHGPKAANHCYAFLRQAGYILSSLGGSELTDAERLPAEILATFPQVAISGKQHIS